jgi:hypothetical protein
VAIGVTLDVTMGARSESKRDTRSAPKVTWTLPYTRGMAALWRRSTEPRTWQQHALDIALILGCFSLVLIKGAPQWLYWSVLAMLSLVAVRVVHLVWQHHAKRQQG